MQKLLAVAVLGASLAFTASAALADEHGSVEPVFPPTQNQTIMSETRSDQSTLAGAPVSNVQDDHEHNTDR